jgi:hypothetical protein
LRPDGTLIRRRWRLNGAFCCSPSTRELIEHCLDPCGVRLLTLCLIVCHRDALSS